MATLSEDSDSWTANGIKRRDFRHSHDGPEELPFKGKRGKGQKGKRFKGCPERDGSAHIYVWILYHGKTQHWNLRGLKKYDVTWYSKECAGCGKVGNRIYPWGSKEFSEEIYETRHVDYDYWK